MELFLKKISKGEMDSYVHDEFIKFSRGVFENRYLVECKKQKDKYSVKTSSEFANFFVRWGLSRLNSDTQIRGMIIATFDISKELGIEIKNVKKYMGIQQFEIDSIVSPKKILEVMKKFPRVFYALSFSFEGFELKIKQKAPKSGKPSNKGDEGPKADFISLKTNKTELIKELFFDVGEFGHISINHSLQIDSIQIPNESDPVKMRENSVRIGKIIRKIDIDGKKETKEYSFKA